MKTLPLLPHESSCPALRAVWRPVKPRDKSWTYTVVDDGEDGIPWVYNVDEMGDYIRVACPFGQPGDVVAAKWIEDHECEHPWGRSGVSVRCDRRFTIASIAVRRVSEMTEDEAVAWGVCDPLRVMRNDSVALDVFHENWPGKEYAWVLGLEEANG